MIFKLAEYGFLTDAFGGASFNRLLYGLRSAMMLQAGGLLIILWRRLVSSIAGMGLASLKL